MGRESGGLVVSLSSEPPEPQNACPSVDNDTSFVQPTASTKNSIVPSDDFRPLFQAFQAFVDDCIAAVEPCQILKTTRRPIIDELHDMVSPAAFG